MLSYVKAQIEPAQDHDLSSLRTVSVTGSPMPTERFAWIYEHVSPNVWFFSISGGTDSLVPLVSGTLLLPVRAGEIQGRCLGVKVEAWDEDGRPLTDEVGEMVLTEPLPSMPLFLWNDRTGERYHESYFSTYPGVWRHGDWIRITSHGGAIIYGRSDATIKRMGVRIGSAEIYRVVDEIPEVMDSLVVDVSPIGRDPRVILFVQLREGVVLDPELTSRIKGAIRTNLSPRHVPDEVIAVPEIPRTLNNKKMEVPVKRILMGVPIEQAVNLDSMSNPESLRYFAEFARSIQVAGSQVAPGNAPGSSEERP
jgi:acetoacetyl-CoA synthetase